MSDWVVTNLNFYSRGNKNYGLRYNKKTGEFQIRERDSTNGFEAESLETIYQNGSWTSQALKNEELFGYASTDTEKKEPIIQPKAIELNKEARKTTLQVYNGLGGKNAGLTLNPAAKNPDGSSGITNITNQSQAEVSPSTSDGTTGFTSLENFPTVPNPAVGKTLVYPRDLIIDHQDTLQITQVEYKSPYKDIFTQGGQTSGSIIRNGLLRKSVVATKLGGRVILPMPNAISDSNSVIWGEDSMDAVTGAATAMISKNLALSAGADLGANLLNNLFPGKNLADIPRTAVLTTILAQAATGGPESQAAARAAAASFMLNRYGFEVSPESILSRGFGVVPNSNIQLLFQNVKLRQFSFQYLMSPRSKEEATIVNSILRWFKQGMAAKKRTLQAGGGALLLGTPNIFKLEYKSGKNNIKGINKFKLCALSNFSVNYTAGGQWVAYNEGQPAAVSMTMAFNEIEPIYDTDYQGTTADEFETPAVKDDEIGF
jgi:hypothetical protein